MVSDRRSILSFRRPPCEIGRVTKFDGTEADQQPASLLQIEGPSLENQISPAGDHDVPFEVRFPGRLVDPCVVAGDPIGLPAVAKNIQHDGFEIRGVLPIAEIPLRLNLEDLPSVDRVDPGEAFARGEGFVVRCRRSATFNVSFVESRSPELVGDQQQGEGHHPEQTGNKEQPANPCHGAASPFKSHRETGPPHQVAGCR